MLVPMPMPMPMPMPAGNTSAILVPVLVPVLLLLTTHQVRCLERVRSALGPAARLFVAVDAPKLQAIIFDELGSRAFITPGTWPAARSTQHAARSTQHAARSK